MSEPTVLGLLKEQIDGVQEEVGLLRRDLDAHRQTTEQGFRDVLARLPAEPSSGDGEIRLNPTRLSRSVRPWVGLLMELGKVALGAGIGAAAMSGSEGAEPVEPPAIEDTDGDG